MLAYNSKNQLIEYEEKNNLKVCNNCHKIYRQIMYEQIFGMRDREYDNCPYCYAENGSSMIHDYSNSPINVVELNNLKTKSLIDTVVGYCNREYVGGNCLTCNHKNKCPGKCIGDCKSCLEEVHYPNKYPLGKKNYDCLRMLQFYVCDYTFKYSSEMLYLMRKSEALRNIEEYRVVSIGCGGCPDLMAFETYCHQEENWKSVKYIGIDVNQNWRAIHEVIKQYNTTTIETPRFFYMDAVTDEHYEISDANVIVLQYVISHFYNTGQINKINSFFDKLVQKIVIHKQERTPIVIMINDVNSNKRGRDYFQMVVDKLQNAGFHGIFKKFYFDYNIQNEYQRYGTKHVSNDVLYKIPPEFHIYQPWEECSSAQLLIEVCGRLDNDNKRK